jgi:hypothetical protein
MPLTLSVLTLLALGTPVVETPRQAAVTLVPLVTLAPQDSQPAQESSASGAPVQSTDTPPSSVRSNPMASPDPDHVARAALTFSSDYAFSADFSDSTGDLSVWRGTGDFQMQFPVFERSQLGIGLAYSRWNFDFTDATAFDADDGDPWSGVNEMDLTATFSTQLTETWSGVFGGTLKSASADGADFSESLTYGGLVGATYAFSENLSIGAGVIVRTELEDDVMVLPLITIDWKISDTLSFSTVPSPGRRFLGLTYEPSDSWAFTAGAAFEFIDFRLDDESPAPEGVGRYQRIPVGGGVTYNIDRQIALSLYGGLLVGQELTLDDSQGDRIEREDIDPTGFIGGGITFRF